MPITYKSHALKSLGFIAVAGLLAACSGPNDTRNGVIGAAGGAAVTAITGGPVLAGAAVGAGAGVICDDVGVCN